MAQTNKTPSPFETLFIGGATGGKNGNDNYHHNYNGKGMKAGDAEQKPLGMTFL